MIHSILSTFDKYSPVETVSAHCDIPCKIYDPSTAQIAVLTMIRLIDLIDELRAKETSIDSVAKLTRLVSEKEAHGLRVKEEIRVIWGDYFKAPQFEQVPNVHELVHNIMLQASKVKQESHREDALVLLDLVNEFANAFWLTKGVETFMATCPYPPSLDVVYPKLAAK